MATDPNDILPKQQIEQLAQRAKEAGVSVEEMIRRAVTDFLSRSDMSGSYLAQQEDTLRKVWDNAEDAVYDDL